MQLVVLPKPKADFLVSDTIGCSPLSITLSDNSIHHEPIRNVWKVAGQYYESENAEITLVKPGSYDLSLSVYNELNCMDGLTEQKRVVVHPKPVALFDIFPSARQTNEKLLLPTGVYHYRIDYMTQLGERVFAVGVVCVLGELGMTRIYKSQLLIFSI